MNTFVIGTKRYRIRSKVRFWTFIAIVLIIAFMLSGYLAGGDVSGLDKIRYETVTVEAGDTLWSIALRYKPEHSDTRDYVAALRDANDVTPGCISPGQELQAPIYE